MRDDCLFDSAGIYLAGKTDDGEASEVLVHPSHKRFLEFTSMDKLSFNYDPTQPTREEILAHGTKEATIISHTRFLRNTAERIRRGCLRTYEARCRELARDKELEVALERVLLAYDILVKFPHQ